MNSKYLLIYELDGSEYFHISQASKEGGIGRSEDSYQIFYYATRVIKFVIGSPPEIVKDRCWYDCALLKNIKSIEDYIKTHNLRCGFFHHGKLVYKGYHSSDPCALFQEIRSIFSEELYD